MKIFKTFMSYTIILMLTGCASIAGNNTRSVAVDSTPPGAKIYVDNQLFGTTPAVITLPTYIYGGKTLTLRKSGFLDQTIVINTQFQPIAILDILFWPSFLIDAASGSLVKIDPSTLNINTELKLA